MRAVSKKGEPLAFSEIENIYPSNYEDLCVYLELFRKPILPGDGKIYDSSIGKSVWANIVTRKRPVSNDDTPVARSIYQLIAELGFNGDFPAMLYLYDRLGVLESEFNAICKDSSDDRSRIFRWAREVFTHASKINAVHGNGNVNVFQYVNMPDETNDVAGNAYITPEQDIRGIVALFGELAANKGKVGDNTEEEEGFGLEEVEDTNEPNV